MLWWLLLPGGRTRRLLGGLLVVDDDGDQDDDDDDGDDEINYCDNNFCTGANAKLATLLIIFFSHFSLDTLTDVDDSEWRCN